MNKLKSTFLRTQSTRHSDDRRSQQFAKKLNAAQFQSYDNTSATTQGPPTLHLDELTEMERTAYQSWWKDLDPFSIGHLDNEAVLKFLRGCCLPDHKLEQILRFFEDTVDGLDELQFYAMLRLIAHAQNGRTISRDMVFLGAPVPRFQTNAIDALIKPAMDDLATPQIESATVVSKSGLGSTNAWPSGTQTSRNSWIDTSNSNTGCSQQQQQQQQQQRPTSWYMGQQAIQQSMDFVPSAPFMSPPQPQPVPSISSNNNPPLQQQQQQHANESSSTGGGGGNNNQQFNNAYHHQQSNNHGIAPSTQYPWSQLPLQPTTTTNSATIPTKSESTAQKYTHSRSRSVPYSVPQPPLQTTDILQTKTDEENLFVFDTIAATPTKQQQQQQRPAPLTSRASMDADSFQKLSSAIDTGQSLLLTKRFVPPKASNNPFESAIEDSPKKNSSTSTLTYSPFADDQDQQCQQQHPPPLVGSTATTATTIFPDTPPRRQDTISSPQASAPPWPTTKLNDYPNKQNLYPPPVPSQATKPAFLKYARNVVPPNYLRRTRSYGTRDRAPSDPFNTNDTAITSTTTTTSTNTYITSFNFNDPAISASSSTSPFHSTEQHLGAKLFRHKSDGSSLLRR